MEMVLHVGEYSILKEIMPVQQLWDMQALLYIIPEMLRDLMILKTPWFQRFKVLRAIQICTCNSRS